MELKTKVEAGEGSQEINIEREFNIPVELLFEAYEDPSLFEQWMSTKVVNYDSVRHGSYAFETSDPGGNVVFKANGVFHEFIKNERIIRTFEMENTPFPVQLEFLAFEKVSSDKSKLTMKIVFKSAKYRNQLLQMPFASGLNMAHNKLESMVAGL